MGKSVVNTNLTSDTTTSTTQTDQSGNQGLNFSDIGGGVGLTFQTTDTRDSHDVTQYSTTDQGAVAAGQALGLSGIAAASSAQSTSVSALAKLNSDSLAMFRALASDSIDASRTATRDAATNDSNFLNTALTGFKSLATSSSASSDERITKLVGMGLVALVLVIALPVLFKSGGAKAAIA